MKFLYAALELFYEPPSDLLQRIASQVDGVSQLGNEAHSAYVAKGKLYFCAEGLVTNFLLPQKREKCRRFLYEFICGLIEKNQYDYVYLKGFLVNKLFLRIAAFAKKKCFGTKVIFEADHYPDRPICKQMLQSFRERNDKPSCRKLRTKMLQHKLLLPKFSNHVNTLVVFGTPVEKVWGIPAITVDTGITVSNIRRRNNFEIHGDPIHILGVIEDPKLCGYDRIIRGMKAYQSNTHRDDISFDIVGSDEVVCDLKNMAEQNGLSHCIHFLGDKSQKEMCDLYDTHSVAISSLGLYRSGTIYFSSRVTKEFCAAGIPFVYAYEDLSLDDDTPFALKLANNDSPINITLIGEFVWRCRLDGRLAQTERKFAEKHYDWRVIMKRIVEFAATGKREV